MTPFTMSMIARQTIASGNAVFQVSANGGALRLLPVSEYEVSGDVAPETWNYAIEQARPTGEPIGRSVPWAGMVHVRYMPKASAPWVGISPLTSAGVTADQLAKIERSLSYDASPPSGLLLPVPDGLSPAQVAGVRNALVNGKGAITPVETTAGGFGQGQYAAPKSDYDQKRFGALIPQTSIDLRMKSSELILGAMGIPPSVLTSEGSALRESYRHFFVNTVEPLGQLIAAELSEKLEQEIVFMFPEVVKSDISARSRAYQSFTQTGTMSDEEARRIIGLPPAAPGSAPPSTPLSN